MSRQSEGDPVSGPLGMKTFREELRQVEGGQDIRPTAYGMMLGDTVLGDTVAWLG